MAWMVNTGCDHDAANAVQWLTLGAAAPRHLRLPALPSPLTFIDVETTVDRIVEVAIVRLDRSRWPVAWHSRIDPGPGTRYRSQKYWNTSIHGLTAPLVQGAPTFAMVARDIWTLCADATVVAHNVSFEHRQLVGEYGRLGTVWSRPELCTLSLARLLWPERGQQGASYSLDSLAAALDVRNPAPHRAIGDVVTNVWVLLSLLERLGGRPELPQALRRAMRV